MTRNFTSYYKGIMRSAITQVNEDKLCNYVDWWGEGWNEFEDLVPGLPLREDMLFVVNRYYEKVFEKNNAALEQLEKIFSNVYDIESKYQTQFAEIIQALMALNNVLIKLGEVIKPKSGSFTVDTIRTQLKPLIAQYMGLVQPCIQWEKEIAKKLEQYKHKRPITVEDKEECIELFERNYPETAEELDKLLVNLPDNQKRDLKFIIYTAEEPYRTIYISNLDSYTIGNIVENPLTEDSETGYFTTGNNTINVDMGEENGNPRGEYATFFHESGHALDYNEKDDGYFYCETYRNSEGKTLQDVIYEDVRNALSKEIAKHTSNKDAQQRILKYMMSSRDRRGDLSLIDRNVVASVCKSLNKEMTGYNNESFCDVYNGVTDNLFEQYARSGPYVGHWDDKGENSHYWYNEDGIATKRQSRELWAEYFSSAMIDNNISMDCIEKHFPNAKQFMDEMAESMAKGESW